MLLCILMHLPRMSLKHKYIIWFALVFCKFSTCVYLDICFRRWFILYSNPSIFFLSYFCKSGILHVVQINIMDDSRFPIRTITYHHGSMLLPQESFDIVGQALGYRQLQVHQRTSLLPQELRVWRWTCHCSKQSSLN